MTYDEAIGALYQARHGDFVAERKRLTLELTRAGDKPGASLLAKHTRPSVSAWVVNQLWWRERGTMEELFANGAQVQSGDLTAVVAHRQVMSKLVAKAAAILAEAEHSASEATLRKVSANLAALTVGGGFAPDPPGALGSDRDPPGFEAMASAALGSRTSEPAGETHDDEAERARAEAAEAEHRAARAKELERAERARIAAALTDAKTQRERLERRRDEQKSALATTQAELERLEASSNALEAELGALGQND